MLINDDWAFETDVLNVMNNPDFLKVFILAISVAALFGSFAAAWIGVTVAINEYE